MGVFLNTSIGIGLLIVGLICVILTYTVFKSMDNGPSSFTTELNLGGMFLMFIGFAVLIFEPFKLL